MKRIFGPYLAWPVSLTFVGLLLAGWIGWITTQTVAGALSFLFIGSMLAVLEIALSFDNAIVNANKLKTMSPIWQRRFLTWGILIAVFGMRIVFPVAVVAVAAWINPFEAIRLAISEPTEYAHIIEGSHGSITAFGGTFLMMVALSYFIDQDKEIDWLTGLECQLRRCGSVRGLEIGLLMLIVLCLSAFVPEDEQAGFLFASILGFLVFTAVDVLGRVFDEDSQAIKAGAAQGGLGAFLYLEVLDASFSFDGVIGAFALSTNIFLIAIGLGIGALYVRSMTIMLLETGTLMQFRYLEHGAFYSILFLSVLMLVQSLVHIPEAVTGLTGVFIVGLSLFSSIRHNIRHPKAS
ncbi:MAG: DUF475 domain-containing protein [Thalassovita sp.]